MNVTEWRRTYQGIDEALAALPDMYAVGSHGDARLVAGPAGAFVVVAAPDDEESAAAPATQLAAELRMLLADHLSWVPFIDTLLVTVEGTEAEAAVVPVDLLLDTVTNGRPVIDERALVRIRDLLRRGALGDWRVGLLPVGDRIDLCDPAPQITPH